MAATLVTVTEWLEKYNRMCSICGRMSTALEIPNVIASGMNVSVQSVTLSLGAWYQSAIIGGIVLSAINCICAGLQRYAKTQYDKYNQMRIELQLLHDRLSNAIAAKDEDKIAKLVTQAEQLIGQTNV